MSCTKSWQRRSGLFAGLALLAGVAMLGTGGMAVAQSKPAKACSADYMSRCLAVCGKAGGQARLCPAYCERKKREAGCS